MVLGLASDGKEARIPREGVVGADLDFDESGKPRAQDNLVTVYMGIPISALPSIINNGPRASLRLGDMTRQVALCSRFVFMCHVCLTGHKLPMHIVSPCM